METSERSRREKRGSSTKFAAFEKLKQAKNEGKKHKYEIAPIENVFEEVSEKEYTKAVLKRQEEDWIVDDYGGDGYVEDGREIFDDDLDEDSIKRDSKKRSRSGVNKNVEPPKGNIEKMFANMPAKRKRETKLDDDDVLGDLMQELESPSSKVLKTDVPVNKVYEEKSEAEEYLRSFNSAPVMSIRPAPKPTQKPVPKHSVLTEVEKKVNGNVAPKVVEIAAKVVEDDFGGLKFDEDDFNDADFDLIEETSAKVVKTVNNKENEVIEVTSIPVEVPEVPLKPKEPVTEEQICDGWDTVLAEAAAAKTDKVTVNISGDFSQLPMEEKDGEKFLKFFYLDAYEEPFNKSGQIFLFGKIQVDPTPTYASCCILVQNIQRRVYLLPREKKCDPITKKPTDELVKMIEVYNEFNDKIADKFKIMKFGSKKVTKNYAFDIADVPDSSEYLEITYPATDRQLSSDLCGETFSHVFGTNTSFLELFLLEKKIKGPSWLKIRKPSPSKVPFSWCKFEIVCDNMDRIKDQDDKPLDNISVMHDGGLPPPLVIMSMSIRITAIPKSQENQITAIGWLVHNNYHTERAAPTPQFTDQFCVFTKPVDTIWPIDIQSKIENFTRDKRPFIVLEKKNNEREMLSLFLAKFSKVDPDLIVGHDIYGFDIGTLIHRLFEHKIRHWSRIGRLRRGTMIAFARSKNFIERSLLCGRLLCDTKISAKEFIRARSYDLDSLCEQVLNMKEGERKHIKSEEVKEAFGSSERILYFIKLTMSDSLYILRIMYNLNVVPLALQITNIAGNVMSRTLVGGRSERNEFLLLHAFNDRNYIVPDKVFAKKAMKDEPEANVPKGKRKPQYEGGLVLEPKRGFYDKLILLMDFNSLYPSIIQEYNICFTTISIRGIDFNDGTDVMTLMNHLPSNAEPGILPTEIRKLVESRRQVKSLMKKPEISSDLRHQYDIRQLALKLTANSMYGCLGFPNSRFYAKPLAALVTAKGREILLNTRDLVQKLNYDVIYGDTDSLMINSNCLNYDEVFNIGKRIKSEVNKLYKQIELDIDGVFQYMLLLKKKKYAAVTMSKVNGKIITKEELKGLDVVRRDWSQISAEAGKFVLRQILSDRPIDDKLANIHGRLAHLKTELEENKVPLSLLAITKQLTKHPEDYPDKKALPHVQVALRMNVTMTKKFKQGDTIAYVICQDGTVNAANQRAYHIEEVKTKDNLKIDAKYYLSQQIHPVISRLCEPIEGIDAVQIAETLGLDPNVYQSIRRIDNAENEEEEITIDEVERFKSCDRFQFKCANPSCRMLNILDAPMVRNDNGDLEFVLNRCCNATCNVPPYTYLPRLYNALWSKMRKLIHQYYLQWMICEDSTCAFRTRNITKIGKNLEPECPSCKRNNLVQEYTGAQLHTQLSFFLYIFDITAFVVKHKSVELDQHSALAMAYHKLREAVNVVLTWNAYNVVDLGKICDLMMMVKGVKV